MSVPPYVRQSRKSAASLGDMGCYISVMELEDMFVVAREFVQAG